MRYANPHPNFNQQQPVVNQTGMYPQQQQPMVSQPQPQNMQAFQQHPNGMISTPYGVMTPQAFNAMMQGQMPQQQQYYQQVPQGMQMMSQPQMQYIPGGQQGMYPQQQFQQVTSNQRFSGNTVGRQGPPDQQYAAGQNDDSRFHTPPTARPQPQPQSQQQQPKGKGDKMSQGSQTTPVLFDVANKITTVCDNSGIKFQVLRNEITSAMIDNLVFDSGVPAVSSLSAGFEDLADEFYLKPQSEKVIATSEYFIYSTHYRVNYNEQLISMLRGDLKSFYRAFKKDMDEVSEPRKLYLLSELNDYITEQTNMYLSVGYSEFVRIDSFVHDYPDLVKFIRQSLVDSEEDLYRFLVEKLANLAESIQAQTQAGGNTSVISRKERLVYIDKFAAETGLDQIELVTSGQDFVKLNLTNPGNSFVKSVIGQIYDLTGDKEFVVSTIGNEEMFRVIWYKKDNDTDVYIKRLK